MAVIRENGMPNTDGQAFLYDFIDQHIQEDLMPEKSYDIAHWTGDYKRKIYFAVEDASGFMNYVKPLIQSNAQFTYTEKVGWDDLKPFIPNKVEAIISIQGISDQQVFENLTSNGDDCQTPRP